MAQTYLSQEEMKALEQTRRGLSALANNIASLKQDLLRSNPLPQWTSLSTSASILANNVQGLTTHYARHAELFNKTVIYPSTNYPGRTQEGVLNSLLRKKLEPPIASWVEEGREVAANTTTPGTTAASEHDQQQFQEWVRDFIDQRVQKYALEEGPDNFTAEERAIGIEHVNTGLRRKLDDDDESDEEEDEEMEDVGVAVTHVATTATGQLKFALGEIKKDPNGKTRTMDTIWMFATTGMVLEPNTGRR